MSMEVEYELTSDDLYAFQWRAAFLSPRARRRRLMPYLGWFLALFLLAIVPAIGPDGLVMSRMSFTFLAIAFPIAVVFQWCFERWLIRRAILQLLKEERPGKGQLGRHKLTLTEAGVLETTAVGESRTSWAGVDRVEQDSQYIFIYIGPHSAHLIPKRAFGSPEEAEAFHRFSSSSRGSAA